MGYFYEKDDYISAKKQLRGEYAVAYKKVAAYIHAANYHGIDHEESCLLQIMDDFLSAQKEGKPLIKITGPNLRRFCDHIIKAESDRMSVGLMFWLQVISTILMLFSMLIFFNTFIFPENNVTLASLNNIQLKGSVIIFISVFVLSYFVKKIISIIFFHYAIITNILGIIIFMFTLGSIQFIHEEYDYLIPISIYIPFPLYLMVTTISIASFTWCCIYINKHKVKYIMTPHDTSEIDEIDKRVCPDCGKTHDCDYPNCPYCKHRYIEF